MAILKVYNGIHGYQGQTANKSKNISRIAKLMVLVYAFRSKYIDKNTYN
jgi:hypothetical protein